MIENAIIITLSVCLFSYLGLKDAILSIYDKIIGKRWYITTLFRDVISCTKCLSFWLVLFISIISGYAIIRCVLVSFICAFLSLWIDILLMYINKIYDKIWEDL